MPDVEGSHKSSIIEREGNSRQGQNTAANRRRKPAELYSPSPLKSAHNFRKEKVKAKVNEGILNMLNQ